MATVTGRLVSPSGSPAANHPFRLQLRKKGDIYVTGKIVNLTANSSGEFSLMLSAGIYCVYFGSTLEQQLFISVPDSNITISFKHLITSAP